MWPLGVVGSSGALLGPVAATMTLWPMITGFCSITDCSSGSLSSCMSCRPPPGPSAKCLGGSVVLGAGLVQAVVGGEGALTMELPADAPAEVPAWPPMRGRLEPDPAEGCTLVGEEAAGEATRPLGVPALMGRAPLLLGPSAERGPSGVPAPPVPRLTLGGEGARGELGMGSGTTTAPVKLERPRWDARLRSTDTLDSRWRCSASMSSCMEGGGDVRCTLRGS
mmetsp:Transcript_21046/g.53506  ORF Transcript_21046/g.53506 Transcript_21046/m.53506 type:complete len:223 (-) Transcript_21046:2431-3099(-)